MAEYTVSQAANKTLTTTVVDTITLTEPHGEIHILHRGASPDIVYVTYGLNPPDPVSEGDDCIPVPAATHCVIVTRGTPPGFQVKVVGSGDKYSVYGLPRGSGR